MIMSMVDVGPVTVDMIGLLVGMLMGVRFEDGHLMIMFMVTVAVLMSMAVGYFFMPVVMFMFFINDEDDAEDHENRARNKAPSDRFPKDEQRG